MTPEESELAALRSQLEEAWAERDAREGERLVFEDHLNRLIDHNKRERIEAAELRAKLAAVEALAVQWETRANAKSDAFGNYRDMREEAFADAADELRAALESEGKNG